LFFFSSRRRHTRWPRDWSSDVCSSDLRRRTSRKVRALLSMSVSGGPELTFNDASGDFVVALSTTPSPSLTLRPIGTGESVYLHRSEERRVGKECRDRWGVDRVRKK